MYKEKCCQSKGGGALWYSKNWLKKCKNSGVWAKIKGWFIEGAVYEVCNQTFLKAWFASCNSLHDVSEIRNATFLVIFKQCVFGQNLLDFLLIPLCRKCIDGWNSSFATHGVIFDSYKERNFITSEITQWFEILQKVSFFKNASEASFFSYLAW